MNLPTEFRSPAPKYQDLTPTTRNAGPSHFVEYPIQRLQRDRDDRRELYRRQQEQELRDLQEQRRRRNREQQAELRRKREQQEQKHGRKSSKEGDRRAQNKRQRAHLKDIGYTTMLAIEDEFFDVFNPATRATKRYNLSGQSNLVQQRTTFYPEDYQDLVNWEQRNSDGTPYIPRDGPPVRIIIEQVSALQGTRYMTQQYPSGKFGVLNFASATRPGGGFQNGAQAQEESLARSSNLYISLDSSNASPFYNIHRQSEYGGYYTHSMIYSPAISVFRDDDGGWHAPLKLDILTSPAVNAGHVRNAHRLPKFEMEAKIRWVMKERMGRILALFEMRGITCLVLGSFGTGVFQNDVRTVARIWRELLLEPGARFRTSFQVVIFALPDPEVHSKFCSELSSRSGFTFWRKWNLKLSHC